MRVLPQAPMTASSPRRIFDKHSPVRFFRSLSLHLSVLFLQSQQWLLWALPSGALSAPIKSTVPTLTSGKPSSPPSCAMPSSIKSPGVKPHS